MDELPPLPNIPYAKHVTGEERVKLIVALAAHYQAGVSVTTLATATGRSVATINRLLAEGGVQMRPRGGARSGPRRSTIQSLSGKRRRREA
jgi:DeoR/GlpR family transcriptional regulator of sugar metabolism